MKKIAFILLFVLIASTSYLLIHSNLAVDSTDKNKNQLQQNSDTAQILSQKNHVRGDGAEFVKEVISSNRVAQASNEDPYDLDNKLKELQKKTKIDLSVMEDGLKWALLDGTAEILPNGNIQMSTDSSHVPEDISAHPSYKSGLSRDEYFAQDTNTSQWARETENQISSALNKSEVKEEFSHLTIYDYSCKDTICRVSFTGDISKPFALGKYFASIPTLGTHRGGRSLSSSKDEDGNTHLYISRNMLKEPMY